MEVELERTEDRADAAETYAIECLVCMATNKHLLFYNYIV